MSIKNKNMQVAIGSLIVIAGILFSPQHLRAESADPGSLLPVGSEKKIVKAIEVKGNKTIGIAVILSKIKTRVGEEYIDE